MMTMNLSPRGGLKITRDYDNFYCVNGVRVSQSLKEIELELYDWDVSPVEVAKGMKALRNGCCFVDYGLGGTFIYAE